jgi:hypothetical protein
MQKIITTSSNTGKLEVMDSLMVIVRIFSHPKY